MFMDRFDTKWLSNFFSIFLEFIAVVDFENKVREVVFKLFLTDTCLIEEMKHEFLGIGKLFPDGRKKGCLFVSEFDDQSAMFLF